MLDCSLTGRGEREWWGVRERKRDENNITMSQKLKTLKTKEMKAQVATPQ